MMASSMSTVIGNGNGNHYFLSQPFVEFCERGIKGWTFEQAAEN
jgi:hypothetical protein